MATQDPSAPQSNRPGWRGRGAAAEQRSAVRHGWQQRGPDHPHERLRKQRVRTRNKVLLLLLACVALVGGLLVTVLYWPRQTPILYIAPSDYQWPLPPLAMSYEDREALKDLDDERQRDGNVLELRNNTLELIDISQAWRTRRGGIDALKEELAELSSSWTSTGPIVIYVCMHGVSDENGQPHLVTPDASALDSDTWLPLQDVLAAVEEVGREKPTILRREKLLVLDCNRMSRNWHMGLLENRFAEGAQKLIQESELPNLAVLISASQGEQALVSQRLQASAFSHFLRLGLSGEAANTDDNVTVRELASYLQRQVNDWAKTNRNTTQQPQAWFTKRSADFKVAYRTRHRLRTPTRTPPPAAIREDLARFWRTYHEMRDAQVGGQALPPTQNALLSWHHFEHHLIWLQQLVSAGQDYALRAEDVRQELQRTVASFDKQRQSRAAPFTFWEDFDKFSETLPAPRVHSVPLNRLVGLAAGPAESLNAVEQSLQAATSGPTVEQLRETSAVFSASVNDNRLPVLIESHLPQLLARYPFKHLSQRTAEIGRLLDLRNRSEQLAAPYDPRLVAWLRPRMDRADLQRRRAEDLLLLNDPRLDAAIQQSESAYQEVESSRAILSEAFALRDRVWAELPYYAIWFTRPDPHVLPAAGDQLMVADKPVSLDGDSVIAALTNLIHNGQALGESLARADQDPTAVSAVQDKLTAMKDELAVLRGRFDLDCDRLRTDVVSNPGAVGDIDLALALPLPRDAFRADLQTARNDFRPPATPPPAADEAAARLWVNRWVNQRDYPALALLGPGLSASQLDTDEQVSLLGAREKRLREYLWGLEPTLRVKIGEGDGTNGGPQDGWLQAERMLRAAAPLVVINRSLKDVSPLDRLRRSGWQQLLIWNGLRALRDVTPTGQTVAAGYDQTASSLDPTRTAQQALLEELADRVASFAGNGLDVNVERLLLPVNDANLRVKVEAGVAFPLDPPDDGQPSGQATLFVRDAQSDVVNRRLHPVPLPLDSRLAPQDLVVSTQTGGSPNLDAVVLFRGFEFTRGFVPDWMGGYRVAFEPQKYDQARVTLHSHRSRRASIMFVLDCSYSMREMLAGESRDDARSRMQIAKGKLQEMLQQLSRQDDVRVGVLFFGHRRGWSRTEENVALTQNRYPGTDADDIESLQPGEDVEEVLELGRFDPLLAERVIDKLQTVVGWGQTPLYLSLVKAESAFAADDPDTEKSIVVITDGRNFQYAPPNNPLGPLTTTSSEQVLEAWRQHRAKIHIVGLGLQDENVAELEREFDSLSRQTGGTYVAARNASTLVRQLQQLLGPGQYSIQDQQGRDVGERADGTRGPAVLSDPLRIVPPPSTSTLYLLQHDQLTKPIEVQPGDALQLRVSNDGQYIEAIPFNDDGLAEEADLVVGASGRPAPMVVRAHPPLANTEEGKVTFRVSTQLKNLEPTPRPAESWVEITPVMKDQVTEMEPTYLFYDNNFLANQPVPVLAWDAEDWPFEQAPYARIRFWCKPTATPAPDEGRIPLGDVLRDPNKYSTPKSFPGLAGNVRVSVETRKTPDEFRVEVIEIHDSPNPDMGTLKIALQADPNAPLSRVERRFDREHRLAIHTFTFAPSADAVFRRSDQAQVQLIPGRLVKDEAWQLPAGESLQVETSNNRDTLRVGPR